MLQVGDFVRDTKGRIYRLTEMSENGAEGVSGTWSGAGWSGKGVKDLQRLNDYRVGDEVWHPKTQLYYTVGGIIIDAVTAAEILVMKDGTLLPAANVERRPQVKAGDYVQCTVHSEHIPQGGVFRVVRVDTVSARVWLKSTMFVPSAYIKVIPTEKVTALGRVLARTWASTLEEDIRKDVVEMWFTMSPRVFVKE